MTDRELQAIVGQAFGRQRAPATWVRLGGGQINDTRLLTLANGHRWVLRVAPSELTARAGPGWFTPYGLRRERAVIEAASALNQYLPVTVAHDFDHSVIDRDWVLQQVMPGVALASIDDTLDPSARSAIWTELGAFTRELHDTCSDRFGPPAWGATFARWTDQVRWDVASLIDDAARFGIPPAPFERLSAAVERLAPLLDEVTTPALIHSDLSRSHVFVNLGHDGGIRLAGVIDLEFGRFADALSEHLITGFEWGNAPIEMRSAFMGGYGKAALSSEEDIRVGLYVAISLAWLVPLLAFQGQPYDAVMIEMTQSLDTLDRLTTVSIRKEG